MESFFPPVGKVTMIFSNRSPKNEKKTIF
jgi:hypothetical protein